MKWEDHKRIVKAVAEAMGREDLLHIRTGYDGGDFLQVNLPEAVVYADKKPLKRIDGLGGKRRVKHHGLEEGAIRDRLWRARKYYLQGDEFTFLLYLGLALHLIHDSCISKSALKKHKLLFLEDFNL
ncbi:hypothetical protein AKJ64_04160 [candidate division MSBL1 archaeon SCGC-AAA259E17]|uniref:Phospholipase C/D domain-containing protein n=1 Tax=candidate division MSBL1 archaeon SCGC-AAA259E17 TaxID=1698263 RepID=A0A133UCZ7_9EURY|nr:hypothetical protein AKJ64_04160 [candidate division MSBL1 archaeon SCGC-AAA259E17]